MTMRWLLVVCAVLTLAACSRVFRDEEPVRHYTLGAREVATEAAEPALAGLAIGLRQPRLAEYLTVPAIAVRPHPNEVRLARNHRWGGNLDREIGRALAEYLAGRADFERVDLVPWPARVAYDYVVEVEVLRFEAVAPETDGRAGEAHFRAHWEIIRPGGAGVVASGTLERRRPGWQVGEYPALVAMLDSALHELADELVVQLVALRARP